MSMWEKNSIFRRTLALFFDRKKQSPLTDDQRNSLTTATIHAMSILDKHGIVHWLDYGSLLGVVREGGIIKEDHDTDMSYLHDEFDKIAAIREANFHVKNRFTIICRGHEIDMEPWVLHEGNMWRENQIGRSFIIDIYMRRYDIFPPDFLINIVRISWAGGYVRAFSEENAKKLLIIRYGYLYRWVFSRNIFFYLKGKVFTRNWNLKRHRAKFNYDSSVDGKKVLMTYARTENLQVRRRLLNWVARFANVF